MLLVGQDGTGWTPVAQSYGVSGSAQYFKSGYVAVNSGTITAAHISVNALGATQCEVYLYSGSRPGGSTTLIAQSSPIDTTATGDRSAPMSGTVVAGQTYTLVVQTPSGTSFTLVGNSGEASSTVNHDTSITYGSPPASLAAPTDTVGKEFVIWIEGTAGGAVRQQESMLMGVG